MVGKPGRSGGAREGAGHPKGVPGGRTEGAVDTTLAPARIIPPAQKWDFAEQALKHAHRMLNILVEIANDETQSGSTRALAADKVLDRAMGKAPQHIDVAAMKHTEIVYRSAEEIRQELIARGVPLALIDYVPPSKKEEDGNGKDDDDAAAG